MQINVYKYEHQKLYNSIATVTILLIYQIGHAIAVCWKMIIFWHKFKWDQFLGIERLK